MKCQKKHAQSKQPVCGQGDFLRVAGPQWHAFLQQAVAYGAAHPEIWSAMSMSPTLFMDITLTISCLEKGITLE